MNNQNKHYKPLTQGERYQIQVLLENGFSITEISHALCRYKSSISREIKRNSLQSNYCAEAAQYLNECRKSMSFKCTKDNLITINIQPILEFYWNYNGLLTCAFITNTQ